MEKSPVRFKRVSAAFDQVARARLCESSGSKHSAAAVEESSADLSELVDSFLERENKVEEGGESEEERSSIDSTGSYRTDFETKKMLLSLIGGEAEDKDGVVKRMIRGEMELACRSSGSGSPEAYERRLMSWLRHKGFDAGLCKSQWEKTAQYPAGEHEYIDIVVAGARYIVEISPVGQFTIARPTDPYVSLLEVFPPILVCREDNLKMVVRLMCAAMRHSLKKREMHVPPWRRNGYMLAKWFGSYNRTTNPVPATEISYRGGGLAGKSLVGLETLPATHGCCRGEVVVRKVGFGLHVVRNLNGMH